MKSALAVRHVHFEHLGALESCLRDAGYQLRYLEAPNAEFEREQLPDLLVILGGPISVNDEQDYPFLRAELRFLERQLKSGQSVLGICLGAQLIARALGSRVFSMDYKEIGWSRLKLTRAGTEHSLRHLQNVEVLHWHGETFDLPAGSELLASTELCKAQAFAYGKRTLGLQFHAEVTASQLESWFVGHTLELATAHVKISELRAQAAKSAALLAAPLSKLLNDWLPASVA